MLSRVDMIFGGRVLRFVAAGVWNTGVSYGVYALAIFFGAPYFGAPYYIYVAVFVANVVAVANNYFTFSIFVFGDRPKTGAMRYLAGFMLNYLFAAAAVGFFADILGINPYISGILAMPIIAALSFVLHNWPLPLQVCFQRANIHIRQTIAVSKMKIFRDLRRGFGVLSSRRILKLTSDMCKA